MENITENLEFWMTNLPEELRRSPIVHLAIPGSHDSMTSSIKSDAPISPDIRPPLKYLKFLRPILAPILVKWSKTQVADITEQLMWGIRYFDLRISTQAHSEGFFFVHNLYSEKVDMVFDHILTFLDSHPQEMVILDCQHFFRLNTKDHKRFIQLIFTKFGQKLLPKASNMEQITLESVTVQLRCQIMLIYRHEVAHFEQVLWPSQQFPTPWPDTLSVSELIAKLNVGVMSRNSSLGYVSQCVLTPNVWYVCKNLFGSLRNNCFLPLVQAKFDWLRQQKPGVGGVNVVISDFVQFQNYKFVKEVVDLNGKLLDNPLALKTFDLSLKHY